jgi:WD repeat-containing protein 26
MLLVVLDGHGPGSVNSVAWHPRNKRMFASCSDDCTVRIWQAIPTASLVGSSSLDHTFSEDALDGKGKGKRREPWDGSSASL